MKLPVLPLAFAILVSATPTPRPQSSTATCTPNILVIARGSTETGNVGTITGLPLCSALKRSLGSKVSCQGIGSTDGYPASLGDNASLKGTCEACITGAVKVFERLHAKCPNSNFMFSGYSQGGALMSNVIPALSAETKAKVIGGVMFGSTRPFILGFPKDKYEAFCAKGDGICDIGGGSFGITAGHLSYGSSSELRKATEFLTKKANGG